jgi:ATP-binding cassette subfamily F protein 3
MLHINNLSKAFYGRFVLKNVSYNFPTSGIVALIGANGAGKTTLLNILCSLDESDEGSISKPKATTIGYLPQDPSPNPLDTVLSEAMSGNTLYGIQLEMNKISEDMAVDFTDEKYERFEHLENIYRSKGGYSFESDSGKLLIGLGFTEEQLAQDPRTLSGGWRMRLELAKLLNSNPDFMILDEPTNHLDLPTITWLEGYLKKFKGTVLFVSHDESLLNRLPDRMLHLKNGELNEYFGNYDDFLEQYDLKEAGKMAELKTLSNKIQTMQRFVDRFKAKASKATQARSRMKMISRLESDASNITVDNADSEINVRIPLTQKSGKDVLHLENCAVGYDKPLMKKISLFASRGQKIAIIGANGLGKSTLIKSIIGQIPFLAGEIKLGHNVRIAYYAQDQLEHLDPQKSAIENIKNANPTMSEGAVRGLLGSFLFKGDDVYKRVGILSGGEKSRLSLASLLVQDANFLLLDEPTNHLDILSIEILSQALASYTGTVMFVSHNRSFINNVATHILEVSAGGGVKLTEGTLEDV